MQTTKCPAKEFRKFAHSCRRIPPSSLDLHRTFPMRTHAFKYCRGLLMDNDFVDSVGAGRELPAHKCRPALAASSARSAEGLRRTIVVPSPYLL